MSEEPLDSEEKEPWEVINQNEHPDPPGGGKCPQCGWTMQISKKNDKVYCSHCEKYKEDMKTEE